MSYEPAETGTQIDKHIYECRKCGHQEIYLGSDLYCDTNCPECYKAFIKNNVPQMVKL